MIMTATALELPVETMVRLPDLRDLAMYLMLMVMHLSKKQIARTFRCSEKQVHAACVRVVYRKVGDDGLNDWLVAVIERLKKILASA
jgi:hypothetical protein